MEINNIYRWFEEYQGEEEKVKMSKLYLELINEEKDELKVAVQEKDIPEILDAIGDILWVELGFDYFSGKNEVFAQRLIERSQKEVRDVAQGVQEVLNKLFPKVMKAYIKNKN